MLVGFETSDDAGVYQLTEELALVQTVDFFTPIVDDPHLYGQIAATNSLSDVYAMGGRPISALSIVAFPPNGDPAVLQQIVAGGQAKMAEAACSVIGGHSIRDDDMKFGYAVTGVINPQRVWRNVGAQPGDVLILTKPLGTGIISTALKNGKASEESLAASIASMTRLNRDAAEALMEIVGVGAGSSRPAGGVKPPLQENTGETPALQEPIHAVTDVTGFGLMGHALEMADASGVALRFRMRDLPLLHGALECVARETFPGGLWRNRDHALPRTRLAGPVARDDEMILFGPETSGGLLLALEPDRAARYVEQARADGLTAWVVGEVIPGAGLEVA